MKSVSLDNVTKPKTTGMHTASFVLLKEESHNSSKPEKIKRERVKRERERKGKATLTDKSTVFQRLYHFHGISLLFEKVQTCDMIKVAGR